MRDGRGKSQKGQPLFIIDQVPYKAALETANANVEISKAEVETAELTLASKEELFKQAVVSKYELQTAQNALNASRAELKLREAQRTNAANNYSYTIVKSPSGGVVGTLPMKEGALVGPTMTTPLTTVSDNDIIYAYFSISENQLLELMRRYGSEDRALKAMPPVYLDLSDGSRYGFSGRIESSSGIIDDKTGSVSMKAIFPNDSGLLHSGGSGRVVMPVYKDNVIVIPKSSTFEIQDKKFVFRIVEGKARSTEIAVNPSSPEDKYIVEKGLKAGDIILSEGVGFVKDGAEIDIQK